MRPANHSPSLACQPGKPVGRPYSSFQGVLGLGRLATPKIPPVGGSSVIKHSARHRLSPSPPLPSPSPRARAAAFGTQSPFFFLAFLPAWLGESDRHPSVHYLTSSG